MLSSLVEVRTLSSDQPRSNFDEEMIEQAANLIIELEGIIKPLVVKQTGINSYEVLHGHFEYYAAVRARELNIEKGETIDAYIVDENKESIYKKQIALFR